MQSNWFDLKNMQLTFIHPFRLLISGVSASGKTCLISQIIKNRDFAIKPSIKKIIWCTKYVKSIPKEIKMDVEAFTGLPTSELIENIHNSGLNSLLVVDDLSKEALSSSEIASIFTTGRHVNLSIVLLVQNFFNKEKFSRDISLNANYIIIMSNNRDASSILPLSYQLNPLHPRQLAEIYFKYCHEAFKYILIDISTHIPSIFRYRSSLFDDPEEIFISESQLDKLKLDGSVINNNYEIKFIDGYEIN